MAKVRMGMVGGGEGASIEKRKVWCLPSPSPSRSRHSLKEEKEHLRFGVTAPLPFPPPLPPPPVLTAALLTAPPLLEEASEGWWERRERLASRC